MPYIDWLSIQQTHTMKLPKIGDCLVVYLDVDTGEAQREVLYGFQHEGSFDTRLQIRCDGRRVEVSGNPSRYGRADNVFGLRSMAEAIDLYNKVLESLDLPPFYGDERASRMAYWFQGTDRVMEHGARIKRVDVCENYACGDQTGVELVLRAVAGLTHNGRRPMPYDGATMWGHGSRYLGIKYYDKAKELRRRDRSPYRDELAQWCQSVGLLRHEVSLRSKALVKAGLDQIEKWTADAMEQVLDKYAKHRQIGAGVDGLLSIRDELVGQGVPAGRAEKAQQAALSFAAGYNLRASLSKSAYYRLRSDLLRVGLDIGGELNVTALPLRVREVKLEKVEPPEWYRAAWG